MKIGTIVAIVILISSLLLFYILPYTEPKINPPPKPSKFIILPIEVYRQSNPNLSWTNYQEKELKRLEEWKQYENLKIENWSSSSLVEVELGGRQRLVISVLAISGVVGSGLYLISTMLKRKAMIS